MYTFTSIAQLKEDLKAGKTNCVDLVNNLLKDISSKKHLNIYLEVFEADALEQAKKVDEKIKSGKAGKLAGVVVSLKDNICYKNHKDFYHNHQ